MAVAMISICDEYFYLILFAGAGAGCVHVDRLDELKKCYDNFHCLSQIHRSSPHRSRHRNHHHSLHKAGFLVD